MTISRHLIYFIFLGLFWGLSQSLYKAMSLQNMPISHVIVYAGFGVGAGLMIAAKLSGTRLDWSHEVIIFGLGCAILLNVPFAIGLCTARSEIVVAGLRRRVVCPVRACSRCPARH